MICQYMLRTCYPACRGDVALSPLDRSYVFRQQAGFPELTDNNIIIRVNGGMPSTYLGLRPGFSNASGSSVATCSRSPMTTPWRETGEKQLLPAPPYGQRKIFFS